MSLGWRDYLVALTVFVCGQLVSEELREYPGDSNHPVYQHYCAMHTKQTLDFVLDHKRIYEPSHGSYIELTIEEALDLLKHFVDPSDPDVSFSNDIHNFQTAQRCRELMPEEDWFHLVGLIHDLGKIMYTFGEPSWAVVGDTFPVGHPFSEKCIYYHLFKENADWGKPTMYQPHCGFDAVHFAWGHDEYLYHVLKNNKTNLPEEALYIIRYHSFYPFHDQGAYQELANEKDLRMRSLLKRFQQCDLYSKTDATIDYESIKPYYEQLIKKYIPGKIRFYKPIS